LKQRATDSNTCIVCPMGFFCDAGMSAPIECSTR
jgi:hypothetical protein